MNITVVEAHTPTSDYDNNEVEEFYDQLQNVSDQSPKNDILVCKETGMQKWAGMLVKTVKAFLDPSAMAKQIREDSYFWSLPPLTILCWRTLLVITKDGFGIAQRTTQQPV